MLKNLTLTALAGLLLAGPVHSHTKSAAKMVEHDLTIKAADGTTHSGKLDMAVAKNKVSGAMRLTQPPEITGTVSGTRGKG